MGGVWAKQVLSQVREECCCGFWLLFRLHCWFLSPTFSWPLCGSQVSTAMRPFSLLLITSSRCCPVCSEPRESPTSSSQPCLHLHPRFLPSLEPLSFGEVQNSHSRSFGSTLGQGAGYIFSERLSWVTQADRML